MKIALVHTNFTRGGGMEAYLLSLVKGFVGQGDDVTVYACKVDRILAGDMGCAVRQIKPWWPRKMREFRFLHRCNTLPLKHEYDLSIGTARVGSPHVAVCGGVHAETVRHIRRTALLRGFYDLLENHYEGKAFRDATYIMAHSGAIAEQIRTHYPVEPAKVQVIYPPIDTERFVPLESAALARARSSLGIDDRRLTVLFVSCGHRRKGLAQLYQAFSELDPKRFELLVAGSQIPSGHPDNVRYIGYINNLAPVYAAVDFTILPSYYEPFGLVVPESMQCGTPVIVTKNVGAGELLTDREAVFLPDNTAGSIAKTLKQLDRGRKVEPGFAERHRLDIDQHIQVIKSSFCGTHPEKSAPSPLGISGQTTTAD